MKDFLILKKLIHFPLQILIQIVHPNKGEVTIGNQ